MVSESAQESKDPFDVLVRNTETILRSLEESLARGQAQVNRRNEQIPRVVLALMALRGELPSRRQHQWTQAQRDAASERMRARNGARAAKAVGV